MASATANDEVNRCRGYQPEIKIFATVDSSASRDVQLAIGDAQDGSVTAAKSRTLCTEKDLLKKAPVFEPSRLDDGD